MTLVILGPPAAPAAPEAPAFGTVTTSGDRIYRRLEPLADSDDTTAGVLHAIAGALGTGATPVDEVARDTDTHPAFGMLLDPDAAPSWALSWLAQFPGVTLQPSDTEQQQRDRISAAAGFYRGTVQAMIETVQATMTGAKSVTVLTRVSGNRWAMTVVCRAADTPDPDAAERAALSQKPAGFFPWNFVVSDEPIIDEAGASRTIDAIGSAGTTIDGITVANWT